MVFQMFSWFLDNHHNHIWKCYSVPTNQFDVMVGSQTFHTEGLRPSFWVDLVRRDIIIIPRATSGTLNCTLSTYVNSSYCINRLY